MLFLGVGDLSATTGYLDALSAPGIARNSPFRGGGGGRWHADRDDLPAGPDAADPNDGYKLIAGMTDATLFRAGVLADVAVAAVENARLGRPSRGAKRRQQGPNRA